MPKKFKALIGTATGVGLICLMIVAYIGAKRKMEDSRQRKKNNQQARLWHEGGETELHTL
jgi:hypothetical protein